MNAEHLLIYFSEVIEEIFNDVLSVGDLLQDQNKVALIQSIAASLDRLDATVGDVMPAEIVQAYLAGVSEATALLAAAGSAMTVGVGGQVAAAMIQKKMHLEAIDLIAGDTMQDLRAAIRTALRYGINTIDNALMEVRSDLAKGMIKGDHSKVVSQKVAKSFAEHGLTSFITKDKRRLPLDFYARTVVRTKIRTAHNTGALNRYKETGTKFIKISQHHPTCRVCAKYQGMVVALEENEYGFPTTKEIPLPPYHPNCQHTIGPYNIRDKTKAEIQEELRKWKRFSPQRDTRTATQRRAYEAEQAIRREANREKKNYAKMKAVMGEKAPKTIGAYRRMKRKNDKKWKTLQSNYLKATRKLE